MRLFRKITHICQNCVNGNNKKGKWIKRKFKNIDERGYWHIFCEKKKKYYPWNKHKRCFDPEEWVKKNDRFN